MTKKKVLVRIVFFMSFISIVMVSIPIISSLQPPASAGSALPHINIDDLPAGSYRFEESGRKGWMGIRWLILKDHDGQLYVYSVPTNEGQVMMPDINWFKWGGSCKHFHPETVNSQIKPNGVIRCHDDDISEWSAAEWRWNYKGKNLGRNTADMKTQRFKIEAGYVVIGNK